VSFEVSFEGSVRVDRSQIRRERITNRRASMLKTTRGKNYVDTRLGERLGQAGRN